MNQMEIKDKVYLTENTFIIRSPLISVDKYCTIFSDHDKINLDYKIAQIIQDKVFMESIAIASENLYDEIIKTDIAHLNDKVKYSIIKYFIRATTRPTPFGTFAGVGLSNFGEDDRMLIDTSEHHQKRCRPDMNWIDALIGKLESLESLKKRLKFRFNDVTYRHGGKLTKLNGAFIQDNVENEIMTSIDYTDAVQLVERNARDNISYKEILNLLQEQYQNVPYEYISDFIDKLIGNNFLISELRPSLINTNVLEHILLVLKQFEDDEIRTLVENLEDVYQRINQYSTLKLGEGINQFLDLKRRMKEIVNSENILQVDSRLSLSQNKLSISFRNELEDLITVLYRLCTENTSPLNEYRDRFIEKYGVDSEIPVQELLDPDLGIGYPKYYTSGKAYKTINLKSEKEIRLERVLERKIFSALRNSEHEIKLEEEDIKYVEGIPKNNIDWGCMQSSVELFLLLHPEGKQSKYIGTLAPAGSSDCFGKSFGRFRDMFSDAEALEYDSMFNTEKRINHDCVIAEVSEYPAMPRVSNISCNVNDYDYQIAIGTGYCDNKRILTVKDLYIGVDRINRTFYIKSKSLNKRVLVRMSSMLNAAHCNIIVRFLRDVSSQYECNLSATLYKLMKNRYEYCPRLTYKRFIIKPETWMISTERLGNYDTLQAFVDVFHSYKRNNSIPRYGLLTSKDHRLLLDLDNEIHLNVLYQDLKNKRKVILTEWTTSFENNLKNIDGERFICEIVVPFFKNQFYNNADLKSPEIMGEKNSNMRFVSTDEGLDILPGQENWVYFKFYGCSKRINEFLYEVHALLDGEKDNLLERYFFIRYADPEPHVRLRIKSKPGKVFDVLEKVFALSIKFKHEGLISRVVLDTYHREVERYGGLALVKKAEEYFYHDSEFVICLLTLLRNNHADINLEYIGCSYILMVLKTFKLSDAEILNFLNSKTSKTLYRVEFQKDRKNYMESVNIGDDWSDFVSKKEYRYLYELLRELSGYLNQYVTSIFYEAKNGGITNTVDSIMQSIIHMFFNRLMGDNQWEQKIYAIARHSFYALQGYMKHKNS